jgi:hypothetical protein
MLGIADGVMSRPAVAAVILERGAIDAIMAIMQSVTPTELMATAGFARRGCGEGWQAMKDLVLAAQAGGRDLTTKLLSCGCIDLLIASLHAVQELGAENSNGFTMCWGMLQMLVELHGEAMPEIESKLRAAKSGKKRLSFPFPPLLHLSPSLLYSTFHHLSTISPPF